LKLIIAVRLERRIKMGGKAFFITAMIMAVVLMGVISETGQSGENEQLAKYYQEHISKCISKNK
jgi:hypothetical protein